MDRKKRGQLAPERWEEGKVSPTAFLNEPSKAAIALSLQRVGAMAKPSYYSALGTFSFTAQQVLSFTFTL